MQLLLSAIVFFMTFNWQLYAADNAYKAYLFDHMTAENYGGLHYSVSTDGLNWQLYNDGKTVEKAYRGHPDIILGHDARYYMIVMEACTGKMLL